MYCLESPDLADGVRVQDVSLPAARGLAPRHDNDLLGGVTVLEGPLVAHASPPWENALYRPLASAPPQEVAGRLIPYYAWSNRGKSEMSVWLPLAN